MDKERGLGIAHPHSSRNHCFVHLTSLLSCCHASGHSRTGGCFCFPSLLVILKKKETWFANWLIEAASCMPVMDSGAPPQCSHLCIKCYTPQFPFLHLHWIETPVGVRARSPSAAGSAAGGYPRVCAASLDRTPHLHMGKIKQAESHPWIFHVASEWLGIDRYGIGGLSLALSISAGSPRDLGWLAWCCAILPSMIWKWI